ncbi:hypothetical protein ACIRH0_44460 [Streptomyces sp. NPDC093675]|uniref:hypothetical protein n=1 Tax=Streptomyces sp. NPDC093675 TaxID=3366049 RepID=UPI0038169E06
MCADRLKASSLTAAEFAATHVPQRDKAPAALQRSATTNGELDVETAKEFFSRAMPREPEG